MVSVAFQLIEEFTAHAQRDSLEDTREIPQTALTLQITYVHPMVTVHKFSKNLEAISKTLDSEE